MAALSVPDLAGCPLNRLGVTELNVGTVHEVSHNKRARCFVGCGHGIQLHSRVKSIYINQYRHAASARATRCIRVARGGVASPATRHTCLGCKACCSCRRCRVRSTLSLHARPSFPLLLLSLLHSPHCAHTTPHTRAPCISRRLAHTGCATPRSAIARMVLSCSVSSRAR